MNVEPLEPVYRLLNDGQVIVECNHVSLLDGILVSLVIPQPLLFPIDPAYSVDNKITSFALKLLQRIGYGKMVAMDVTKPAALRTLERELSAGGNVMIFPEGQISPDGSPRPELPGSKWLKTRTGAKSVRLHIRGAERSLFFSKSGRSIWPRIAISYCLENASSTATTAGVFEASERPVSA